MYKECKHDNTDMTNNVGFNKIVRDITLTFKAKTYVWIFKTIYCWTTEKCRRRLIVTAALTDLKRIIMSGL